MKSGPSCSWFGLLAGAVIVSWVSIFLGISQGSGAVIPENRSTWFVDMNRFTRAAHAGLRCEDCHGTMMEGTQKHPEPVELRQEATRVYDYSRCKSCHLKAYERYGLGGHAKVLREQTAARATGLPIPTDPKAHAPTCGHCHSSHYDRSGLSRLDTGIRQVLTCGSCHPAHAQSYLEDRHGRVGIHLEGANAANNSSFGYAAGTYCIITDGKIYTYDAAGGFGSTVQVDIQDVWVRNDSTTTTGIIRWWAWG